MAFYKFLSENAVESFCSGNMLFRNIEYFRRIEEKEEIGRLDKNDGMLVSHSFVTPSNNDIKLIIKANREQDCIMCVSRNLKKKNFEKMNKMGNMTIIIEDEDAFINKIRKAAEAEGYNAIFDNVFYYKDELDLDVAEYISKGVEYYSFCKQERFQYQQEYRFLLFKDYKAKDEMMLNIGDINNIVKTVPTTQLYNFLCY